LQRDGHDCGEPVRFRSRWFWTSLPGWIKAIKAFPTAFKNTFSFKPQLWLTYHTYYKSPDILGPWICRLLSIPYVLFQPMYATRRRKERKTIIGFYLNRIALKSAKHAFVNNTNDLDALKRILPANCITYLPPGIFPEEFQKDEPAGRAVRLRYSIPENAALLMTAARFRLDVKFQSLAYLFGSLAMVEAASKPFMLLVVGDGPGERELRRMAEQLLPGRVLFTGGIPREEMFRYYSAADFFVFPGIGESLGMVFLEAQACGLPVVALNTGGIPQVVRSAGSNQTGLLVPLDDGAAMAAAVEALLTDSEWCKRMGSHARTFVEKERNLHLNMLRFSRTIEKIAGR
jgi:glycosyltransferase involved in cell wall biosynthesis